MSPPDDCANTSNGSSIDLLKMKLSTYVATLKTLLATYFIKANAHEQPQLALSRLQHCQQARQRCSRPDTVRCPLLPRIGFEAEFGHCCASFRWPLDSSLIELASDPWGWQMGGVKVQKIYHMSNWRPSASSAPLWCTNRSISPWICRILFFYNWINCSAVATWKLKYTILWIVIMWIC